MLIHKRLSKPWIYTPVSSHNEDLWWSYPGSAGDIFWGKKTFGRYQRKRPLFHGLSVYVFSYSPLHSSDFFYVQLKWGRCLYVGTPCFNVGYDGDPSTHTWWQWRGIFHGIRNVPEENVLTVPLGWAFEVKDGIASPTKGHWKFPALGPSVPQGTICSQWATTQERVFIQTSRLKAWQDLQESNMRPLNADYLQYVKRVCVCFLQPPIHHRGKHSKTGPKNRRNCMTHSPATLSCTLNRNPRRSSVRCYSPHS